MAQRRSFHRTDRLNRQIKQVLAVALLRETREGALRSVVVTDVEVTRDLSIARVYYYLMNEPDDDVGAALKRASGFLRSRVGQGVRMRQVPELRFIFDPSIERGRRVEEILADLDLGPSDEDDGSEDGDI